MKAIVFENYLEKFLEINEYLKIDKVDFKIIKFKNGEGKIIINESVKNEDVIIFSDFTYPSTYYYKGRKRVYSSDEYYVELKRVLSALDSPKSISIFLPLIYQSRQNANNEKESKDYLMFIDDLKHMGVSNIITFEAHGEDNNVLSYSLANLFKGKKYDAVVSPDKGGEKRSIEYSKVLECNNCYFNKKRDLENLIDGSNPINEYNICDYDFKDKRVLIVDDILDSGSTIINAIRGIKDANLVDVFVAYPLFSKGVKMFKKLHNDKKLNKIYISNLIYVDDKYLKYDFIETIDSTKLVANVINEVIK